MRIRRVLTTREGGVSTAPYDSFNLGDHVGDDPTAVSANRERLAEGIGLDPTRLVWMEQVHGRTVTTVTAPLDSPAEATDALVTAEPNLALVVLTADCVPVLLGDPTTGVIGAVHAGRVGARVGVVPAAVKAMTDLGAKPENIEVLLGPAVCGKCYEVPAAMMADVEKHLPGSASKSRAAKPALDLRAGLWAQLAALGIGKLGVDPRCTFEERTLFSHRREPGTGRLGGVIWVDPS
ncbi:peptidoglycan editing factor PgeF [Umezawaea endophytica]|uniref:Purine nucleoside phosphorylase n=1 Tax=Umezawaea endophytica TaxID=1654476 RepID=A0A9X2VKL9_9PSEU|nr:peptidoglycan editing factor PgeF [Umezawaea endophytica]MCS7478345.1 peptidoglycan editing factor PgeF [Umezawaea endophytica]